MAKRKSKKTTSSPKTSLPDLQQNADLWYRIHVLLYDLNNLGSNRHSNTRTSSTTNELYISTPYFTDSESLTIRTTLIDNDFATGDIDIDTDFATAFPSASKSKTKITMEEAIHQRLANFFDKRKASGDARPCGPHDMLPIFAGVFGINVRELNDEGFLRMVRRVGVGDFRVREGGGDEVAAQGVKKKRGKGGKDC